MDDEMAVADRLCQSASSHWQDSHLQHSIIYSRATASADVFVMSSKPHFAIGYCALHVPEHSLTTLHGQCLC